MQININKMKSNKSLKKWIISAVGAIVVLFMIITTVNKARTKQPELLDYKTIQDVPGIEFQVKKSLSDSSTAVLEVSDNINFIDYQTYLFRNGKDTYLLFNIKQFIVIAKKGTTFNLSEQTVKESFEHNSLQGIWFTADDKDVDKKSADKYVVNVDAQVVITNKIYNDFTGKLIVLTKDGVEWSLFVGTVDNKDEDMKTLVSNISNSICYYDANIYEANDYEISLENGEFTKLDKELIIAEPSADTDIDIGEDISNQTADESTTPETVQAEIVNVDTENNEEEQVDNQTQERIEDEILPVEKEESVKKQNDKPKHVLSIQSNQYITEKKDSSAYTSTIYSMLNIGDTGYMDLFSDETVKNEGAYIQINKVNSNEETLTLIEEYCKSDDSYYKETKAPDGTHYESIIYSVQYTGDAKPYVNIKLCGLDGEALRFRGIEYSSMTFDILNKSKENGVWSTNYICYYIVPNGCKEYVLKCGDGKDDAMTFSAYYKFSK